MRWVAITLILMNVVYFSWRWLVPNETRIAVRANAEHQLELDPQFVTIQPSARLPIIEDPPFDGSQSTEILAAEPSAIHALPSTQNSKLPHGAILSTSEITPHETASIAVEANTLITEQSSVPPQLSPATPKDSESSSAMERVEKNAPVMAASDEEICYWTEWRELPWKGSETLSIITTERREIEVGRSYLVWIPPKATQELTIERLRELKSLSIESAFINRGEQKGGISLGLFSAEESVSIRMKEAEVLGISDAKPLTRVRTQTQTRALIKQTTENNKEISEKWQKTDCLPIANTAVAK